MNVRLYEVSGELARGEIARHVCESHFDVKKKSMTRVRVDNFIVPAWRCIDHTGETQWSPPQPPVNVVAAALKEFSGTLEYWHADVILVRPTQKAGMYRRGGFFYRRFAGGDFLCCDCLETVPDDRVLVTPHKLDPDTFELSTTIAQAVKKIKVALGTLESEGIKEAALAMAKHLLTFKSGLRLIENLEKRIFPVGGSNQGSIVEAWAIRCLGKFERTTTLHSRELRDRLKRFERLARP